MSDCSDKLSETIAFTGSNNTDTASAATPVTIREVNSLGKAFAHLIDDYGILIIEFDKENNLEIHTLFKTVGLEKIDRLFECQDRVRDLRKVIMRREQCVAQGFPVKVKYYLQDRAELNSLDEDSKVLCRDIQLLRLNLEGGSGYVYRKTQVQFKVIPAQVHKEETSSPETNTDIKLESSSILGIPTPLSAEYSNGSPISHDFVHDHQRPHGNFCRARKRLYPDNSAESDIKAAIATSPERWTKSDEDDSPEQAIKRRRRDRFGTKNSGSSIASTKFLQSKTELSFLVKEVDINSRPLKDILANQGRERMVLSPFAPPTEREQILALRKRIQELEDRTSNMAKTNLQLREERNELMRDRQSSLDRLKEQREALRNMTRRKNQYRAISRGSEMAVGEVDSSYESEYDSEEEIPAHIVQRIRMA